MTNPRIEVYRGAREGLRTGWYWRLRATNGRVVADGAEGYSSRRNAIRAARRVEWVYRGLPERDDMELVVREDGGIRYA